MIRSGQLEFVRLAAGEIDDQATAEIATLLGQSLGTAEISAVELIRLAANGPLVVARRPCGAQPEIVGVAGYRVRAGQGTLDEFVVVDPREGLPDLEPALKACLHAHSPRFSLFRGRGGAPLGLRLCATA